MDGGWELLGQAISLSIAASVVLSVWFPVARVTAGLLLLGLAVAVAVLTAWRLGGGHDVRLAFLVLTTACLTLAGALLFSWGRRTSTVTG